LSSAENTCKLVIDGHAEFAMIDFMQKTKYGRQNKRFSIMICVFL